MTGFIYVGQLESFGNETFSRRPKHKNDAAFLLQAQGWHCSKPGERYTYVGVKLLNSKDSIISNVRAILYILLRDTRTQKSIWY